MNGETKIMPASSIICLANAEVYDYAVKYLQKNEDRFLLQVRCAWFADIGFFKK